MDIEDSRNRLDDLFSSGNNEKALQVAFAMLSTDGSQASEVSGSALIGSLSKHDVDGSEKVI